MNAQSHGIGTIVRAATLVAANALLASSGFAATRCAAPADHVDRAACAKAKESPDALRHYVERTQALYQLYFWDYITPEDVDRYHAQSSVRASDRFALGK